MPVALLILFLLLLCLLIRKVIEFTSEARSRAMDRWKSGLEGSEETDRRGQEIDSESQERRIQQLIDLERRLGFRLTQPVKDWLLADNEALDTASALDEEDIRAIREPFSIDHYKAISWEECPNWELSRDTSEQLLGLNFPTPFGGCLFHSEQGCGIHTLVIVNPPELAGRIVHIGYCPIFLSGHIQDSVL